MSHLNVSIPHFYALIRREFLFNLEEHQNELEEVVVFGLASVSGRALGFHVLTEGGGIYWRVPIHALCHGDPKEIDERPHLQDVQAWDCFGEDVTVTTFDYLVGMGCEAAIQGQHLEGEYAFTVDWTGNGFSDEPSQNKCLHILKLDNGWFAAMPNNRIRWFDKSFTIGEAWPQYKTNTQLWRCEK